MADMEMGLTTDDSTANSTGADAFRSSAMLLMLYVSGGVALWQYNDVFYVKAISS